MFKSSEFTVYNYHIDGSTIASISGMGCGVYEELARMEPPLISYPLSRGAQQTTHLSIL